MKCLINRYIYISIIVILTISCTSKQDKISLDNCPVVADNTNESLITCNIASVKDTLRIPLSFLLTDFEIIQLESKNPNALTKNDGHITCSENYIGIYSTMGGGYKLFNKKGEYLSTLSSKGNGPNEYTISIYDSFIDDDEYKVYLLPMIAHSILVYDFNGNIKQRIPLPYTVHKGRFLINNKKKEVLISAMPFNDSPLAIWKQDFNGNILQELSRKHLILESVDYSNELNYSFNTQAIDFSLFHWIPTQDTLYHYNEKENSLSPIFTVIFKEEIKQHDYIELPNQYIVRLINPYPSHSPIIFIDKNTLKGCYAKFELDILGNIGSSSWIEFNRGYYINNMYPHELKEELSKILSQKEKLSNEIHTRVETLYNDISEESNNIIIIGRLKQDLQKDIMFENSITRDSSGKNTPIDQTIKQSNDDRVYKFEDLHLIKETPTLANAKEYFRNNNKYKNWDSNNSKEVVICYIVEKNGTTSNLEIKKSSNNADLDKEALRLIKEAIMLPGTNQAKEAIRCGDTCITVFFPPQ